MNSFFDKWSAALASLDRRLADQRRWPVIIFGLSFVLKLFYVLESKDALHVNVPIMDSEYYFGIAEDVVGGKLTRDEVFFMGPLYPYTLAAIFATFGKSILAARIVQIAGGALTIVLAFLLGRMVFRPVTALVAAFLLMLYGTTTFFEGQLLMMWLGSLLNMAMLYVIYRWRDDNGLKKYVVSGALLGISALARSNILVFAVVFLLWMFFVCREKRRWTKSGVFVGMILVAILPATIHNYYVSREFVATTSNGGVNFFIGNSKDARGIFYPPEGIFMGNEANGRKYVERILGKKVTDSELSRYWYDRAFEFIKENPAKEAKLLLKKTVLFFNGYEVPQIEAYEIARERYASLKIMFVPFWIILSLSILGMLYRAKEWRSHFLLYGYLLSFAGSIVLFFIAARYRAQVVPVFCLFAAHGLVVVLPQALRNARHSIRPLVFFVLILALTAPRLMALPKADVRWREHIHQARRLSIVGRYDEAIEEMDKAILIHPKNPDSYAQRGYIQKERGKQFDAISDYTKALDINPNYPTLQYDLAQLLRRVQLYELATENYERAIALSPMMLEAYNNLGVTYRDLHRYKKAIENFQRVIELDPEYVKAYNNEGASYAELGEDERAIASFKKAIEVKPDYANSYKNLAMVFVKLKRVREAHTELERYLELAPDDGRARHVLGQLQTILDNDSTMVYPNDG